MKIIGMYKQEMISTGIALLLFSYDLPKFDPEYPDLAILPKNHEVTPSDYCIISGENLESFVKNSGLT